MPLVLLAFLMLPLASAGTRTWDTLESDTGRIVRGLDIEGGTGLAVGDDGLLLRLGGEDWTQLPAITDRDLLDVKIAASDHAMAVGEGGVVLGYGRLFDEGTGHPSGVTSAYGSSGSGASAVRRTEWSVPLWRLRTGPGDTFAMGVVVESGPLQQAHPADFRPERPASADAVVFNDIPYATPTVDGVQEALWTGAVHATYASGDVPFSLYLVRDNDHLYVLTTGGTGVAVDDVLLQFHATPGVRPTKGDLRLVRSGTDTATKTHAEVRDALGWTELAAPGELGVGTLYGAGFLDDGTPLAVGAGGKLLLGEATGWLVETLTTGKTFRAVDARGGTVYVVGGSLSGDTGAVVYRYEDGQATQVSLPAGTYGLHDIDLQTCRAVGSGGVVLTCIDASPDAWSIAFVGDDYVLEEVTRDGRTNGMAWAAGSRGTESALFRNDGGTWKRIGTPNNKPITALSGGLGGVVLADLGLDILALRPHAPVVTSMPTSTTGPQGEPLSVPFQAYDPDNDVIRFDIELPDDVPPDQDIEIFQIDFDLFELVWIPDPDLEGIFDIKITLSDGDFNVTNNTTVIIIDQNFPPVWDPHPDVTIPHSLPWTTTAHASDPDNDPLVLSAITLPVGATFADLGGDAQVDWTPTPAQVGPHTVTLRADDGALTADLTFTVLVIDNQPPIIDTFTPQNPNVCVKGPYYTGNITFRASAHDPEGGALNFTWTFFDDMTTAYGGQVTHTYTTLGTYTVTLTVTDPAGLTAMSSTTVRVDDCIWVEGDLDIPCYNMLDQATGWIRIYDHTGAPANGTFRVRVWYDPLVGPLTAQDVTGQVVNGEAYWTIPYDHQVATLTGLNEPLTHTAYITGFVPNTFHGDTESMTVVRHYVHTPACIVLKEPIY